MLIATLAVEWGTRALRINALEVGPDGPASTCAPLIRYMAGPAAQYLTGQAWSLSH